MGTEPDGHIVNDRTLQSGRQLVLRDILLAVASGLLMLGASAFMLMKGNRAFLAGSDILPAILSALTIPRVAGHLLAAGVAFLGLHLLYPLVIVFVKRLCLSGIRLNESLPVTAAFLLMGWLFILSLNAEMFPMSQQVDLLGVSDSPAVIKLVLAAFGYVAIPLMLLMGLLRKVRKHPGLMLIVIAAAGAFSYFAWKRSYQDAAFVGREGMPNIIIIGIDSLRPDLLNGEKQHLVDLPAMRELLDQSTIYTDVTTPVARTFPAWSSILTAQYPHESGIRVNLQEVTRSQKELFLTHQLRGLGYRTFYATDEARFSNIDKSYGFDEVITPVIGAPDFLIGHFSDLALVNIAANIPLMEMLLPWVSGNRAVKTAYIPQTFDRRLRAGIRRFVDRDRGSPVFMVVHFCLPHWPYTFGTLPWHDFDIEQTNDYENGQARLFSRYLRSLEAADQQVKELVSLLKSAGVMENTVVALLSDHGEVFSHLDHGAAQQTGVDALPIASGHGADVFSDPAYEVVFAVSSSAGQTGGVPDQSDGSIQLVHVLPIIADVAGLQLNHVAHRAHSNRVQDAPNIQFRETGLTLPGLFSAKLEASELVEQGIGSYSIGKNGYVTFRSELLPHTLQNKEYAVVLDRVLYARSPRIASRIGVDVGEYLIVDRVDQTWSLKESTDLPEIAKCLLEAMPRGQDISECYATRLQ